MSQEQLLVSTAFGIEMDAEYLDGIARPRLQAELDRFERAAQGTRARTAEADLWAQIDAIRAKGQ